MDSKHNFIFENLTVNYKALKFSNVAHTWLKKFFRQIPSERSSQFKIVVDSRALNTANRLERIVFQFYNYLGNISDSVCQDVSCSAKARTRKYGTFRTLKRKEE
ncbi:four helix bundle protein [Aquimarina sp. SS2-1]|uniref:four helix bundle protein n=1 Tax=Aquimarina besae TaxID=3342247 RepID=UPI0036714A50